MEIRHVADGECAYVGEEGGAVARAKIGVEEGGAGGVVAVGGHGGQRRLVEERRFG